jgi:glycosyltransferase involved in cell wall biosynthesis
MHQSITAEPTTVCLPGMTTTFGQSLPEVGDITNRIERKFDELDTLFAQIDSGEFNLRGLDYAWPESLKLSIVIPVYNERKSILQVISRVSALPVPKEIIVVDDCSTDGTRGWLETIRDMPNLRLIFKPENQGKGAALRTGFDAATGDIVIIQDADLEYDPSDILQVVKPIVCDTAEVVYGSRYMNQKTGDASRLHRGVNRLLTGMFNLLSGTRHTDMETCYKAFKRSILDEIELKQNRFGFEPEFAAKIARRRYRVEEVPIQYNPRGYAEGKKIGVKDLFSALWCILRYGWAD